MILVISKNSGKFVISLAYSYFELRSKVLSLGNAKKKQVSFCISFTYSYLCSKNRRLMLWDIE